MLDFRNYLLGGMKSKMIHFSIIFALFLPSQIKNCQIELLSNKFGTIQSGCRIIFENLDNFNIWTVHADNIFYGKNKIPPNNENENLKIELIDIKTLHNKQ